MQHTKEFLGCDATFVTTKEIFHKDFGTPWASDVECAGGKAAPAFGYRVNPVTFEADQRFYGTQRDKAASTGSRDSEAAWYKAYHTENGDEFRDPQIMATERRQMADEYLDRTGKKPLGRVY